MIIAGVVIEQTAFSFDKPYSYLVPNNLVSTVQSGCRVIVPFGKGNTHRQGMIVSLSDTSEDCGEYKSIISVIDSSPVLNDELLSMCEWMHNNLLCTYFDAIKAALPVGISFKVNELYSLGKFSDKDKYNDLICFLEYNPFVSKETLLNNFSYLNDNSINLLVKNGSLIKSGSAVRKMNDASLKSVRLLISKEQSELYNLTDKQRSVLELLFDIGSVSLKELLYFTGVSSSVVNTLEKKGIVEFFDKEVYRTPDYERLYSSCEKVVLTEEQNREYIKLEKLYESEQPSVSLLYGVTGSGKTSVFLKLVERAVNEGKGAIVMVPEISLTPQTIERFGRYFGRKIAVFHSAMSIGQRMDEFKRVQSGEALIAIGTRSAIFAPVKNLSLIIIDEEQEHTYKSEKSPRFHARDLAKFRTNYNNSLLVLASATPSMESYALALGGRYSLCKLPNRYGHATLPDVVTVDMRKELVKGNTSAISCQLSSAIYDALNCNKQAIVLLNRRGHNTYISCSTCGYVETCPNCSVTLTYHSANKRLMCHYCGHSKSAGDICPSCNSGKLRFMGIGTQKVEEELKIIFPDASILRLDADSTSGRGSVAKGLEAFSKGEYDILLGTQMVAKGLDFPNVTVVGVLGADSAANSNDYRSFERSFSLLTQVLGRAGRGNDRGVAVIQTCDPDSNLIRMAVSQNYDAFYNQEILTRKMMVYPPFCDIFVVAASSSSKSDSEECINNIFSNIKKLVDSEFTDIKLIILGPAAATVSKINNKYRYRIIIKSKNSKRFREMIKKALDVKSNRDTSIYFDINPEMIV